jgi:hypothetical protein
MFFILKGDLLMGLFDSGLNADDEEFAVSLKDILWVVFFAILILVIDISIDNHKSEKIKAVAQSITTQPQVIYHYNMSRADWQDYQYRLALKDIDTGVREQRMHNATLAAQRQAVVECRGGIEWLALAVPAAQFVSTGVPCTLKESSK